MTSPDVRAADAYQVLFDRLPAGAARCHLIVERGDVVAVEILDSNRAFEPVRDALPRLLGLLSRVRELGRPETLELRDAAAVLAVAAYPVGGAVGAGAVDAGAVDEVIVTIDDVTERDQLAQRARDWQVRFEQAFHGNAAAMVIANRSDLRILDVNPRWLELFGATRAEVVGKTSVELGLISEDRASTRIAQHTVFADGYDVELELATRGGKPVTVLASAQPIEIAEGRCTLTTLINITSRKRAEQAFAAAFNASPAGMMLVDAASDAVIAVNDRLLEMTEERRDELIGRRSSDLPLVRTPSRDALLAEIERSGRLDGVEVELTRKSGPGVWTLASTELVTLHGEPHRLSVFTEITARKVLERRLLVQNLVGRRLSETGDVDAALPHVLELLCRSEGWDCGAIWLPGDDEGALQCCATWCDPSAAGALAAPGRDIALLPGGLPGRVLATGVAEKRALDPASCARAAAMVGAGMRHAVGFPILRGSAVVGVVALATRGGSAVFEAAERGLFDSIGRLLGLFLERTRAEASLRELNAELEGRVLERTHALETSNRDLEAFGWSVSHDLRAPLRAILGFSDILLDEFAVALPGEARDLLGRIHAGGRRLHQLVDDLLGFARLGRGDLQRSAVELDPLVRSVLDELLAGRAIGDRLALQVEPLGQCSADASLLRTVWMNLIDNALKYAQPRERIELAIGREVRGGEVVYFVRDNGVGFDMARAERLFGVFQRMHAASEFDGTGIGLASVRRIVERHGGRVAARSEIGRGSQFEFTLGPEVA